MYYKNSDGCGGGPRCLDNPVWPPVSMNMSVATGLKWHFSRWLLYLNLYGHFSFPNHNYLTRKWRSFCFDRIYTSQDKQKGEKSRRACSWLPSFETRSRSETGEARIGISEFQLTQQFLMWILFTRTCQSLSGSSRCLSFALHWASRLGLFKASAGWDWKLCVKFIDRGISRDLLAALFLSCPRNQIWWLYVSTP